MTSQMGQLQYTRKEQRFWTCEEHRVKSRQDIDGCRMVGFRGIRGKGGDLYV